MKKQLNVLMKHPKQGYEKICKPLYDGIPFPSSELTKIIEASKTEFKS
ncbi:MAG: hypothetical protein WD426_04145 [Anditalea sp.]